MKIRCLGLPRQSLQSPLSSALLCGLFMDPSALEHDWSSSRLCEAKPEILFSRADAYLALCVFSRLPHRAARLILTEDVTGPGLGSKFETEPTRTQSSCLLDQLSVAPSIGPQNQDSPC